MQRIASPVSSALPESPARPIGDARSLAIEVVASDDGDFLKLTEDASGALVIVGIGENNVDLVVPNSFSPTLADGTFDGETVSDAIVEITF